MASRERLPVANSRPVCFSSLFTMRNLAKFVLLQALPAFSVFILIFTLIGDKCQATQLQTDSNSQSSWVPLNPTNARLALHAAQLKAQPKDGTNFAIPAATTMHPPSSTVSSGNDMIQSLLFV